jgi:hypothetical protein
MNKAIMLSAIACLASGLAAAQANGQAAIVSGYATTGVYSAPFVPLVSTPSVTLEPTALQIGYSGETNDVSAGAPSIVQNSGTFNLGVARSEDSYGAAELKSWFHPRKAAKVYTNQDVAQVNDTNGLVKFGNKTEHL